MLEEMIKLLLEMGFLSRCFVTNIILADEEGALAMMEGCLRANVLTGEFLYPSAEVVNACKIGRVAAEGKRREEFLVDMLASLGVVA